MTALLIYKLCAVLWFFLALARGAYVAGYSTGKYNDDPITNLFWYAFLWGAMGGILWPLTLPFAFGYKLGQERRL